MIVFKDGTVDNRRVLSTSFKLISKYALVANEDGTFEHVCIDDSHSSSPTDPIYGGPLVTSITFDATDQDRMNYKLQNNIIEEGDIVRITSGRKMVGEIKKIKRFFTYVVPKTYNQVSTEYAVFEDGTKVNKGHLTLIK